MTSGALLLVLLSAALHATWNFIVKSSAHPRAFVLLRAPVIVVACLVGFAFYDLGEIPHAAWPLIVATGVTHTLYFAGLAGAYTAGDISLVYPIARSAPAFVPIFAVAVLGERLSPGGVAGIAVVVVSMWIVHTGGRIHPRAFVAPGAAYAYFTLATVVTYSLIDKRAMTLLAEAPWTGTIPRPLAYLLLEEGISGVLYALVMAPRIPRETLLRALGTDWRRVLLTAALDTLSYVLVLHVLATEQVSYVVAVRQTSVVIAVLLGVIFLRERFGRARVVGATLMVAGVTLIARFA